MYLAGLFCSTLRRLQRVSRIGLVPIHVAGRLVDRWDVLPCQSEPRLHLSPVMAGVQDTTPVDPYPFPLQAAEEFPLLQPPRSRSSGKLLKPSLHEPQILVDIGLHGRLFARWQEFFDGRFLRADELAEEALLRQ
jgi:hypothetical protein